MRRGGGVMWVDNMNGEWIDTETASWEALEEAREEINRYYPEGGRARCVEGGGYFDLMREGVNEINEELTWRRLNNL